MPRDADDAALEATRQEVERELNRATARAYELADRGTRGGPVSGTLPAALRAYRLLSAAAAPFAPLLLARRLKRGKEHGAAACRTARR